MESPAPNSSYARGPHPTNPSLHPKTLAKRANASTRGPSQGRNRCVNGPRDGLRPRFDPRNQGRFGTEEGARDA